MSAASPSPASFALAIALSNGFGIGGTGPIAASPTENPAAGGGVASCLVYDPASLPTNDVVFDGTVTAIDGDQVTFDVNEGWKGADGSITLTAPVVDIALSGPMPDFEVGGRYLVTALRHDHQRVRLHARLRRRHRGRVGGGLRRLIRVPTAGSPRPRQR